MNYAVINVQDPIGKTVGRRRLNDAAKYAMGLQNYVNHVRKSQGFGAICRRGVFRFCSHEEADRWMIKELVERVIRKRS